MKLSVKALTIASALLWGGCILLVGTCNVMWPTYGTAFLEVVGSIYSGYHPGMGMSSVIVGSLYGVIDAAIGGAIFAWLYNLLLPSQA